MRILLVEGELRNQFVISKGGLIIGALCGSWTLTGQIRNEVNHSRGGSLFSPRNLRNSRSPTAGEKRLLFFNKEGVRRWGAAVRMKVFSR